MSDQTFHVTGEDVRKMESNESKFHGGEVPKDSDTSAMKVSLPTTRSDHAPSSFVNLD